MTFRFDAKYGLLTYAQSDGLDPWAVVEMLGNLGAECIVGKEDHQGEGSHLHAFFTFDKKFCSRNARIFDVGGFHPNILSGRRTPEAMWDYATKDGDVVAGGLERPVTPSKKTSSADFWTEVFDAETEAGTYEAARVADVALYGRYYFQIRAIAQGKSVRDPTNYVHDETMEFRGPYLEELSDWVENHLGRRGNRLVILSVALGRARPPPR